MLLSFKKEEFSAFAFALLLALAGGFADAGSFVLTGSFTGHITGNAVLFAVGLGTANWSQALLCLVAVVCFLAGTWLGAIGLRRLLGARTIPVLGLEMVLIVIGILAASRVGDWGFIACLCLALGLQNGMLRKRGTLSVHSLYITGMSTSLLTEPQSVAQRRLSLAAAVSFVVGAGLGGGLVHWAGLRGFAVLPALLAICAFLAVCRGDTTDGL